MNWLHKKIDKDKENINDNEQHFHIVCMRCGKTTNKVNRDGECKECANAYFDDFKK